jgi:hypothetical protein
LLAFYAPDRYRLGEGEVKWVKQFRKLAKAILLVEQKGAMQMNLAPELTDLN